MPQTQRQCLPRKPESRGAPPLARPGGKPCKPDRTLCQTLAKASRFSDLQHVELYEFNSCGAEPRIRELQPCGLSRAQEEPGNVEPSRVPRKTSRVLLNTSFNRLCAVTAKLEVDLPSTNDGLLSLAKPLSSIWSIVPATVDRWFSIAPCIYAHADTRAFAFRSRLRKKTPWECWKCCSRNRQAFTRTIPYDLWKRRAASAATPSPHLGRRPPEGTPLGTSRSASCSIDAKSGNRRRMLCKASLPADHESAESAARLVK